VKRNLNFKRRQIDSKATYWFDVVFGGLLTFAIIFLVGNLNFMKFKLQFLNVPFFVLCLILVIYYQWKDDNFEAIETGLSEKENFELTENALKTLNWKYRKTSKRIEIVYENSFFLKFLDIQILPENKTIYFNFRYESATRGGRLPFFFGISSIIKRKFIKEVKSQMN